jgi:hypothetical protein
MAKNSFPGMKTGGGVVSKVIGLVVLGVVLALIVKYPGGSAHFVKTLFSAANTFIDSL